MRPATPALVLALSFGCAHEVTPEERLDRATQNVSPRQALSMSDLTRNRCNDAGAGLLRARAENQTETERLQGYLGLYESLKKRTAVYEDAIARNSDLAYTTTGNELSAARDVCIQATADVHGELDRYLRDLVAHPSTEEIRGGASVMVARADFELQKRAVATLGADDRDALNERINASQLKLGAVPPARKTR